MAESNPVLQLEKLCRIWSEHREQELLLRVSYQVTDTDACRIVTLTEREEIE
jgi:hypothetical protein